MSERRTRKTTRTSDFGSPGRESHDATAFYTSKLYEGMPAQAEAGSAATSLPDAVANRIFCASSEHMQELPDNSIHLMVTSPPYNVGKQYDEDLTLAEYRAFLRRVWAEVKRVLAPGGRACINVANLGRKPYIPLHAYICEDMIALGFLMRGEIIWNKGASSGPSTAWGSWRSAKNPTLRDVHEYILVFSKEAYGRPETDRSSTIGRDEFLDWTKSVWSFGTEAARKIGHPAPFPVELPQRLIQLYTFAGDVVLDPFMGSGQTALAALRSGRRYVGYDTDASYVRLAEQRIAAAATLDLHVPAQPSRPQMSELMRLIGEAGRRISEIEASEGAAGNISVYAGWPLNHREFFPGSEPIELPAPAPHLAGGALLVTGSGRRLREVLDDPLANLGLLTVEAGGATGRLWFSSERRFERLTSEFNSHLAVHNERVASTRASFHTVIHAQPLHLTYLSHRAAYQDERYLNTHLLRWQPEAIYNLPEGIGFIPFFVPGSADLMVHTLSGLRDHRLVVWARHGVVARADESVTRACDLIEYAETAARYECLNLASGEQASGLTVEEIRSICRTHGIEQEWF